MSPELEQSIKERIAAGISYEQIEAELVATGYTKEAAAAAYARAIQTIPAPVVGEVELSSGTSLFKAGLTFAQSRLDLVLLLGVTSAILNLTLLYSESVESLPILLGSTVVGFGALLLYALGLIAAYYMVAKAPGERVSVETALRWSVQNILSVWWIFILAFLLIWAGFILLIVPGIIMSFLLYFSQYAYIHEGERGMGALLRSRAVMIGRMVPVLKRMVVFFLYTILISMLAGIPYGFYFGFVEQSSQLSPVAGVLELLTQLVTAVLTVAGIVVGNQLFLELRADRPRDPIAPAVVKKYQILAWFGAVAGTVFLVGIAAFIWFSYAMPEFAAEFESTTYDDAYFDEAVRDEVIFTELIAEGYFNENSTYEGVCDVLLPAIILADDAACNDSVDAWALAANIQDTYWCTDTMGYGKQISSPLGERTRCLNLPVESEAESMASSSVPAVEEGSAVIPSM